MVGNNYRNMKAGEFRVWTALKLDRLVEMVDRIGDHIGDHDKRINAVEKATVAIINDKKSRRRLIGTVVAAAIAAGGSVLGTIVMAIVMLIAYLGG